MGVDERRSGGRPGGGQFLVDARSWTQICTLDSILLDLYTSGSIRPTDQ